MRTLPYRRGAKFHLPRVLFYFRHSYGYAYGHCYGYGYGCGYGYGYGVTYAVINLFFTFESGMAQEICALFTREKRKVNKEERERETERERQLVTILLSGMTQ
jgi:hypothetical protein